MASANRRHHAISWSRFAWFISGFRLDMAGDPLELHSRLHAHYRELRERPAFAAEVRTPGLAGLLARAYGGYRRLRSSTLGNLLATAS